MPCVSLAGSCGHKITGGHNYRAGSMGFQYIVTGPAGRDGLWDNNVQLGGGSRSYNVWTFGNDGALLGVARFDVYGTTGADVSMANYLNSIPTGTLFLITTYDEPQTNRLTSALLTAMQNQCGAGSLYTSSGFYNRGAYMLMGKIKGGVTLEAYSGGNISGGDPNALITVTFAIRNGSFISVRRTA